jgi:hypothetical protein
MTMLDETETKPAAGVIATRPTTAPMHAPIAEGFRPLRPSIMSQTIMADAEAKWVVANAIAPTSLAPRDEPALNPNQPNHKRPVPNST